MMLAKFNFTILKILFFVGRYAYSSENDTLEQVRHNAIIYTYNQAFYPFDFDYIKNHSFSRILIQLIVGYTNVPLEDDVVGAEVEIEEGVVPTWIEGSFVRHTCQAFGETEHISYDFLNRVDHLFDCISGGQSYSFHNGKITYNGQYWDTNMVSSC